MTSQEQTIYNVAIGAGFPDTLARILIAQAQHESANFTSNLFLRYNNAFGYSFVPGARWQLPTPGTKADNGQPIAAYASLENSAHEIVDWIKRRQVQGLFPADLNSITDPYKYAELLKKAGYYGDTLSNYAAGLKSFFKNNAGSISIVALLAIGAAAYFIIKV